MTSPDLSSIMNEGLPFNRKERYFTGTVFPAIVCKDNFKYLNRFLGLIDTTLAKRNIDISRIQFFTEYSLNESIFGQSRKRFPKPPSTRETPDIILYLSIDGDRILIAVEAKMYNRTSGKSLTEQMALQRNNILDYLIKQLNTTKFYHVALLPRKLKDSMIDFTMDAITWENVLEAYEDACSEDYFYAILRYALDTFGELYAGMRRSGSYNDDMMTGKEIVELYRSGKFKMKRMGRVQGFEGDPLRRDIETRQWENQYYEVAKDAHLPNRNWFLIKDFVKKLGI